MSKPKQDLLLKEDSAGWLSLAQITTPLVHSEFLLKLDNCTGSDLTLPQSTNLKNLFLKNKDLFGEKQGLALVISHT